MLAGALALAACVGAWAGSAGEGQEGVLEVTETPPVLAEEELTSRQMCIQTHRRVHVGSVFMLENNPQVSVSNNGLVLPGAQGWASSLTEHREWVARALPVPHLALTHSYFVLEP